MKRRSAGLGVGRAWLLAWLLALLGWQLVAGVASAAEPAVERADPDPPLCRQALALHPGDEIRALRSEERERWRRARRAQRAARKANRGNFAASDGARARALVRSFGAASEQYAEALREAMVLCRCRERRGDPDGADCSFRQPRSGP